MKRNAILLFLIPADSDDIIKEYGILLNELEKYNPELLQKQRVLGISKADMLDDELMNEMEKSLPKILSLVFHQSLVSYCGIKRYPLD